MLGRLLRLCPTLVACAVLAAGCGGSASGHQAGPSASSRRSGHPSGHSSHAVDVDPAASWPLVRDPVFSTRMPGTPKRTVQTIQGRLHVVAFATAVPYGNHADVADVSPQLVTGQQGLPDLLAKTHARVLLRRTSRLDGFPAFGDEITDPQVHGVEWDFEVDTGRRRIIVSYEQGPPRTRKPPFEFVQMVHFLRLAKGA